MNVYAHPAFTIYDKMLRRSKGMSRVKHLTMLIVKLVLFVLVFALTAAMMAMQDHPTDGIPLARDFDESNIDVILENGATLDWEITDGELTFDITQSGENYDDITVLLFFDDIGYDSSFIRSLLGDDAGKHEEFLSDMENGPWLGHFNFCLKGDSFFTTDTGDYTLCDDVLTEYVESVVSSDANKSTQTEQFTVEREDESVMVGLMFGAEDTGALKSGRYTLDAELKLGHPDGEKLNLGYFDIVGILFKVAGQALAQSGLKVFSVTNWLTLYCVWVILGWFIYLWRDLRAVLDTFLSASIAASTTIIIHVYVNGIYTGSREESDGGWFVGLIYALIVWFVLTITIPIRMLWYVIRDIIYLFKEDELMEDFSYTGNLLGSIGIHVILMGIAGVIGVERVFGAVALIVGIGMCIGAHFLCRSKEY